VLLGAKGYLAAGITLPGVGYVDLGIAAPLLWEGLLVALAECARIADGMDGIVCGASFAAMLGLMGVMTLLGWFPLGVLPAALAGALMAFLLWNFPPAKLLPGSVGSLFLAGMLGCVPLCIGWPDLTLPLALPFWLEGGMVALQIIVWKASGGRRQLFGTAPLHRWLEKRGFDPVNIFYIFGVLAMLGLALTLQAARAS
jgi:phospho-N-acetylmuramoyl-pentapeptide-transferase